MMDYYIPGWIGLVLASIGVISLPVHLANYRERGILRRFRASGVREWAMLAAQILVGVLIAMLGALLLSVLGAYGYHMRFPASLADVALAFFVSAVAFSALGMLLASVLPTARAAQSVGLLLWFLMMFVSGTGGPLEVLPSYLLAVGKALPLYHVVIPMVDAWNGYGINATQLLIVGAIGMGSILITVRVFHWE
jgi:ABC-2 type transport system permease protein